MPSEQFGPFRVESLRELQDWYAALGESEPKTNNTHFLNGPTEKGKAGAALE